MPCYTPPHSYCNHESKEDEMLCDAIEPIKKIISSLDYYRKKSDEATSLLCELLKEQHKNNTLTHFPERFQKWYLNHEMFDNSKE